MAINIILKQFRLCAAEKIVAIKIDYSEDKIKYLFYL